MTALRNIISILALTLILTNCKNDNKAEIKTVTVDTDTVKELDPNATYAKAEFTIDGMTCAIGCAAMIQKNISKMDGIKYAKVDFDRKLAMVEYNEAKINPASLEETVTSVANTYKVSNMKTVSDFSTAKTCNNTCCAEKTAEEKANCTEACCVDKTETEKKECAPDCKKVCCAKKA